MVDGGRRSVRQLRGLSTKGTGLLWFRNLIVNRISFPKRIERGYDIGEDGEFYVKSDDTPIKASRYLIQYNLRCKYESIPTGKDGRISAIVITKDTLSAAEEGSERKSEDFWILFSHGNNTDIGHQFFFYARLCSFLGVNLVSYDYSGFGLSSGKPSEEMVYENIYSVYEYMRAELKVPADRILLYGKSLGSAPACFIVSQPEVFPVGGLVLHSPLASGLRVFFKSVARHHWYDAFDNAHFLVNCPVIPVFLMHGILDEQVPVHQAVELTCIIKEAHEAQLSKMLNVHNRFHLEEVKMPQVEAEHTHLNQENIEILPRARFAQALEEARRKNLTTQYVKTWWVEGAGHEDLETENSADYYDHLTKFLDLCRKWREGRPGQGA